MHDLPFFPMQRDERCPFDPAPELLQLQKTDPIARVRLWDGTVAWLITSYARQRALLSDARVSSDARLPGYPFSGPAIKARRLSAPNLVTTDNPEHDRLRKMLTRDFMAKRINALRPRIQQIADELIDVMLASGPSADLVEAFALPLPSLAICEILAVPYEDHAIFQGLASTLHDTTATADQGTESIDVLRSYVRKLVDKKYQEPVHDDVTSHLLELSRKGILDKAAVIEALIFLVVAGHETTANMLGLSVLALLSNSDQLEVFRSFEDPIDAANAIEELLRYLTIAHAGRRRVALEDLEIDGQIIRAGEGLIMATEAGNRDPEAFTNPGVLDVRSAASHHMAFGFGIHQCLGQLLARAELQIGLWSLFTRIPSMRLSVPLEQLSFKQRHTVYGVRAVPIEWG
jgi:cytochrome P450